MWIQLAALGVAWWMFKGNFKFGSTEPMETVPVHENFVQTSLDENYRANQIRAAEGWPLRGIEDSYDR